MKIVCVGGGPAGLYFGLLMKKQDSMHEIVVVERNRPDAASGWGVVFSDQALDNLFNADEPTARMILQSFNRWNNIDVHFKGHTTTSSGHGFCGIGRKRLLNILQQRCEELGVKLVFETDVADDQMLAAHYRADVVIACDGVNSRIRTRYQDSYRPAIEYRKCRFAWMGTTQLFPAFTFAFEETEHGWFQAHAYQYDGDTSTFIIETPEEVWQRAGLHCMNRDQAIGFCEKIFSSYLGGHPLLGGAPYLPGSATWTTFSRITSETWVHWNVMHGKRVPVVLMGDAAHTAHFSIGSGTKLAMEDAIELAGCFAQHGVANLDEVMTAYQKTRVLEVLKIQNAASNSMEWFENVQRYAHLEAAQFSYSMLTRSQRLSHENLRMRDAEYVEDVENWIGARAFAQAGLPQPAGRRAMPPMLTPFKLRSTVLKNRIVVSPMAQYSALDGLVGDYHLVHLGSRAMGGAGLVFAEMTCISADARITPGCPGLYRPEHTQAWQRIVEFVHANTDAKIAIQLGHAGPKGSTRCPWDGMDQPLEQGNWPLLAASAQQYAAGVSAIARAATLEDMTRILDDFVRAAEAAAAAGFDWLELHCAHGYLLSSFISPLTNQRDDEYGGKLENRCRYPLEVFAAIRAVWPQDKPISVRISAHDWVEGGITPDDAVAIARLFKQAGADMIDCSSGQVSKNEQPLYGRMFQTPFADRIRNEVGIPCMAVGGIFEADHVNSIIAAGRADLCALARPHLANPAWTLAESAKIGYYDMEWPKQYRAGKLQLERNLEREKPLSAGGLSLPHRTNFVGQT
jgi:anthraniloyl-CoA monooxygenase